MFEDLNDLYQQVILDHCRKPRNFHELPAATCSAQGRNPLCGDQLKLFLALDGDMIKDISFVGSGCCISKASASLLTEFAKGKFREQQRRRLGNAGDRRPTKLMSLIMSPSSVRKSFNWSPQSGLCPCTEQVAAAMHGNSAVSAVVKDDLLVKIV